MVYEFSTFVFPPEILAFNDRLDEFQAINAEVIIQVHANDEICFSYL